MKNQTKLKITFSILLSSMIMATAFSVLTVFRPFTYIDNATSKITCSRSGESFDIGWNFIYTFTDKLDHFNDVKARKLCEFGVIKDYINSVETPLNINYRFEPKYIQDSSWPEALTAFFGLILVGIFATELVLQKLSKSRLTYLLLLISLILGSFFFFAFLRRPSSVLFCKRQKARKVNNFKRIVFKYGVVPIPEEDKHINSIVPQLYQNCLNNEAI